MAGSEDTSLVLESAHTFAGTHSVDSISLPKQQRVNPKQTPVFQALSAVRRSVLNVSPVSFSSYIDIAVASPSAPDLDS